MAGCWSILVIYQAWRDMVGVSCAGAHDAWEDALVFAFCSLMAIWCIPPCSQQLQNVEAFVWRIRVSVLLIVSWLKFLYSDFLRKLCYGYVGASPLSQKCLFDPFCMCDAVRRFWQKAAASTHPCFFWDVSLSELASPGSACASNQHDKSNTVANLKPVLAQNPFLHRYDMIK